MDYRKAYFILFNAITDALRVMEKMWLITDIRDESVDILKNAQITTEAMCMEDGEAL